MFQVFTLWWTLDRVSILLFRYQIDSFAGLHFLYWYWLSIYSSQNGIYPNGSIYKDLKDKLRSYPKSRCLTTQTCVDLVKSGNHVYINVCYLDKLKVILINVKFVKFCNKNPNRVFLPQWMLWKMIFRLRGNVIWLWSERKNTHCHGSGLWLRKVYTRRVLIVG